MHYEMQKHTDQYPIIGVNTLQEAPTTLTRLQQAAIDNGNVFAMLVHAVRCCSLGQITSAMFEVGGQYRRGM